MAKNIRHIYDHIIEETKDQQEETLQHKDDRTDTEEDEYEEPCSERTAAHKRPADGTFATPNPPKRSKISSITSSLTPESASKTSTTPISGAGRGVSTPESAKQPWRSARENRLSDAQAMRLREPEDEIVDPNRELSTERAAEIAKEMFRGIFERLHIPPVSVILEMRRVHIEPQGLYSVQASIQKSNLGFARWECAPVMAWMGTTVPEEQRLRVECDRRVQKLMDGLDVVKIRQQELMQEMAEHSVDLKDLCDPGWKDAVEAVKERTARFKFMALVPMPSSHQEDEKLVHELNEKLAKISHGYGK